MAYNKMTADEIRSAVRSITDLDEADVSDTLLDLYIRDGYYRILDLEKRWDFLETSFNFNTRANVRSYTIADLSADSLTQISSIVDNTAIGYRLDMISYDEAEGVYVGSYDTAADPLFYAIWGGQVHLYPKPDNVRTLVCRGYREPIDWQTEDGEVDASPSLHFPLVYYAVSRVYQQLEDPTMAQVYKQSFDEGVAMARRNIMQPNSHTPLILAHGKTKGRPTFNGWLQSLGKQLEQ